MAVCEVLPGRQYALCQAHGIDRLWPGKFAH